MTLSFSCLFRHGTVSLGGMQRRDSMSFFFHGCRASLFHNFKHAQATIYLTLTPKAFLIVEISPNFLFLGISVWRYLSEFLLFSVTQELHWGIGRDCIEASTQMQLQMRTRKTKFVLTEESRLPFIISLLLSLVGYKVNDECEQRPYVPILGLALPSTQISTTKMLKNGIVPDKLLVALL